jgi:hypothetical protein
LQKICIFEVQKDYGVMTRFFALLLVNFLLISGYAQSPVSPSNGLVQTGGSVTFEWNACSQASQYRLQISSDASFSPATEYIISDTDTTLMLTPGVYHWRVSCLRAGNWLAWSNSRSFSIIDLNAMGTLALWLDAGNTPSLTLDGSNGVSSWTNGINAAMSFTQPDAARRPRWIAQEAQLNNQPLLRFDGTDDFLNGGNVLNMGNNSRTFFLVGKSKLKYIRTVFTAKSRAAAANK